MHDGTSPSMRRVAIIGGGFSGTVCAVQLARRTIAPLSIEIFEPRPSLGGGVAYSTEDPAHRINVPAAKMVVFAEDELDFERWLRQSAELERDPVAIWPDGSLYPSRLAFGRYIASLVDSATHGPSIRHVTNRVIAIEHADGAYRLMPEHGDLHIAELVVLAVSHPPPTVPGLIHDRLPGDASVIVNPWADHALARIGPDDEVLIMGTGLTMADIVASLDRAGHRGRITAFSRHGLASRGHPSTPHAAFPRFGTAAPPETALKLLRMVRAAVADAAEAGLPWHAVFDDLRGNARRIWDALPTAERLTLLRHLRAYWDAHRYRIAPQAEAVLDRRRREGTLEILAASLRDVGRMGERLEASLHPRFTPPETVLDREIDWLIVATGPGHGQLIARNPALASLEAAGLIQPDATGLGLLVDDRSRAIRRDGSVNETLLVAGPLARGTFGELMGLPQVSRHAELVAAEVAAVLGV